MSSPPAGIPEADWLATPAAVKTFVLAQQQEIEQATARLRQRGHRGEIKVLTSCPSCLQGLHRYDDDAGTDADYVVVEMARHLLGADWLADYLRRANAGGIERVLV